jgi:DNA-binding HxlR family transcriptional regulator
VIESRGGVTIKDIAGVLPGISTKTIQRELSSMIQDGVLTKAGERRWTVYSKA